MKESDVYGLGRIKRIMDKDVSLASYRSNENAVVVKVISNPEVEEILEKYKIGGARFMMEVKDNAGDREHAFNNLH